MFVYTPFACKIDLTNTCRIKNKPQKLYNRKHSNPTLNSNNNKNVRSLGVRKYIYKNEDKGKYMKTT